MRREQVFDLNKKNAYSFVKAPRYEGTLMEVGPLARMIIKKEPTLYEFIKKGGKVGVVARHLARALEAKLMVEACYNWLDQLFTEMTKPGFKIHDTEHWEVPEEGIGYGFHEAPRGFLDIG